MVLAAPFRVTVLVPAVNVPLVFQLPLTVQEPEVAVTVEPTDAAFRFPVIDTVDVLAFNVPDPATVALFPTDRVNPSVFAVPAVVMVKLLFTVMLVLKFLTSPIVRLKNGPPSNAGSVIPPSSTEDVPGLNVPSVLIQSPTTVIVEPLAFMMPLVLMNIPPATSTAKLAPVSNVVVEEPSLMFRSFPTFRFRVDMVNVCGVPALETNVRLLNSGSPSGVPAKVIVPPLAESNNIEPLPLSHTALSVLAFVHVPDTVQLSLPKAIADEALEIFTLAATVTLPDVDVRSPPLITSTLPDPLIVIVLVFFASVPPEIVREVFVVN